MFEFPRYVIKSGEIIVDDGEIRRSSLGRTLYIAPDYDRDIETDIAEWFEQYYSIRFRNYPVADDFVHGLQEVPCRANPDD
jgi:formylmethanofuran dehydrogenase subunit A